MSDSKPTTQKVLEYAMGNLSTMSPAFMSLCDKANDEYKALENECVAMRDFCHKIEVEAKHRKDLTLWGIDYGALPVDADDVPIHVGDWITSRWGAKAKVVAVTSEDVYWWEPDGCHWCHAFEVRHYHEPTVVDVLHEFVTEFNRDDTELCDDEIIERFAKRLQLAEGDTE